MVWNYMFEQVQVFVQGFFGDIGFYYWLFYVVCLVDFRGENCVQDGFFGNGICSRGFLQLIFDLFIEFIYNLGKILCWI